ncbi:MAG: M20 family metallopeptidase [Candidatus Nanohalobium sp.]
MKVEELAKKLMEYKTVSPVEDPEVFQFLKGILEDEGINAEVREINGVYNLVAETGDRDADESVCLNGHMDVVEAEGEWSATEPFEPVEKDGKLYGRGAADMKGALAAQVKAFIDLHRDSEFNGRAVLMAVGDEEIGGFDGSKALANEFNEEDKGFDHVIVGEPTDLNVQVGTRGLFWANVTLKGESVHATRPHLAEMNTMEELPEALERLRNLEMSFENNGPLPDPSSEVTIVESTDTYNSIPAEVKIGMDVRYLPGQEVEEVVEDIDETLKDLEVGVEVEVEQDHGGDFKLEDEKFRKTSVEVLTEVRGEEPEQITEGGASDGRFFSNNGTPFIELGVNQASVHGESEYCEVENLKKLRKAYFEISKRMAE